MARRRRSRGVVTPPMTTLEDSDSDSDASMHADINCHEKDQDQSTHWVTSTRHVFSRYDANDHPRPPERKRMHFDSSDSELDDARLTLTKNQGTNTPGQAKSETLQTGRFLGSAEKGEGAQGMKLRSGSQIKGMERFLNSSQSRSRRMSDVSPSLTRNLSNNALQYQQSPIQSRRRESFHSVHDSRPSSNHVTTTTAAFGLNSWRVDEINTSNNARPDRPDRHMKRAPVVSASRARGSRSRKSNSYTEDVVDRRYRLRHMYDMDDSDTDSFTSSFGSTDGFSDKPIQYPSIFNQGVQGVMRIVTSMSIMLFYTGRVVYAPFQILSLMNRPFASFTLWLSTWVNHILRGFIKLDAWVVSRISRKFCCFSFPLLLLPSVLVGGYYVYSGTITFSSGQTGSAGIGGLVSRSEIEAIVRSMLNPEMQSLKVNLLNMAKGGSFDQSNLKVTQDDSRLRLESLEQQMASVSAKTKLMDDDMYNAKNCVDKPTLTKTIEEQISKSVANIIGKQGAGSGVGNLLDKNYIDKSELDQEMRMLSAELREKITRDLKTSSSGGGSNVESALIKFSADKTGIPDYALESAGGSVLTSRCSPTFVEKTAVLSLFGIPLFYMSSCPRSVIQPEVLPGNCWAFKGQEGHIVIQMAVPVRPTGFSMEHIPKSLSIHGNIDSAPRDFTVIGLLSESDYEGVNLGKFTYQTVGTPIQNYDVDVRNPGFFKFVELRVLNNHGNKDFTCIYRFRVHGIPMA